MNKFYDEVNLEALDGICKKLYNKTFNEVTNHFSKDYQLNHIDEYPSDRTPIPRSVQFRHAPDGYEIDEMLGSILLSDVQDDRKFHYLKRELEYNISISTQNAVKDALISMSKEERFFGPQKARLNVTSKSITLIRLQPIRIPQHK